MGRTRAAGISNPGYNHSRQADKILNALQRLLSISLVKAIRAVARSRIRRFLRVPCPDLFFCLVARESSRIVAVVGSASCGGPAPSLDHEFLRRRSATDRPRPA